MTHKEKAMSLFREGYNCAQAVLCAFDDVTGLDRQTSLNISSTFGGGLSRLREICGAVSGAAMVLGTVYGGGEQTDITWRKLQYARVQKFAEAFREMNGSYICRELLNSAAQDTKTIEGKENPTPEERTMEYYKKRPCVKIVGIAAELLDQMLESEIPNLDKSRLS